MLLVLAQLQQTPAELQPCSQVNNMIKSCNIDVPCRCDGGELKLDILDSSACA